MRWVLLRWAAIAVCASWTHSFQLSSRQLRPLRVASATDGLVSVRPTRTLRAAGRNNNPVREWTAVRMGASEALEVKLDPVVVFDGVFGPDIAEVLGDYGPGVYRRWMGEASTPVEEFIESILLASGDNAKEVEYWGRTDWLAVEGYTQTYM